MGQYFDPAPPSSEIQTRIDKAVLPVWPGGGKPPIDKAFEVKIPKGTQVYVGEVESQGGAFVGGSLQVVVLRPWEITGVDVIEATPLL